MKFRVLLLSRAQTHVRQILNWISQQSPQGANLWLDELDAVLVSLEDDPERFPPAAESSRVSFDVRELSFQTPSGHRYRLLFTVVVDEVRVLCLLSARQARITPRTVI